ncbi:MAG: hypothetical protein ACD_63C00084G0001 [uncultured bacterium]|nr:MAG: hypothetical protein ACD_63C00084G0001 [uncultured bacterium]
MSQLFEKDIKDKLEKVLDHFRGELAKLRTGRAHPSLVEDIVVDYYGSPTLLKQMASISTPEARVLLIQPWDKNSVKDVERAILASKLGLNPSNEGDKIRIMLPPLVEETRSDLTKLLGLKREEAKVAIRNVREEVISSVELQEGISEDEIEKSKKTVQKVVDEFNARVKDVAKKKEEEIMTL